ncbi:hypothetical protein FQR65_LT06790 [Abscondita terminalis]|nr:hypothetical protein FQR65_LT06790 [Abscondita terminalis]
MKFLVVLLALGFFVYVSAEGFECVDEVAYRQNDCNNCRCNAKKLLCSKMACHSPESKKLADCVVGTQSTINGKECNCVEGMGTICVKD